MENNLINKSLCQSIIKQRDEKGNKGTFGKVCLLAGSEKYPGAGVMASIGAMRSGVGITTLGLPDVLKGNLPFKIYPEIILKYFLSIDGGFHIDKNSAITLCEEFESILVGSGWGIGKERFNSLKNISELYEKTLVIDADCLNMIAKYEYYDIFSSTKASIIITPHIAEMARLCKTNNEDIIDNQEKYAHEFASKYNITVVLKSYKTIVANKNSLYVNLSPNSGLAKGGSGDLLAGLIAGLVASKIINGNVPLNSAICGVYLHSQAGLLAAEKYGKDSMTISDVAEFIPNAFKSLR